jgi:hypothetical protein
MLVVHPPISTLSNTKSLRTFDDCIQLFRTYEDAYGTQLPIALVDKYWLNIYQGIHEGMDVNSRSKTYDDKTTVGHLIASHPNETTAVLDYCIRRGYNTQECQNNNGIALLHYALRSIVFRNKNSTRDALSFIQILADAQVPLDDGSRKFIFIITGAEKDTVLTWTKQVGRTTINRQVHVTVELCSILEWVIKTFDKPMPP